MKRASRNQQQRLRAQRRGYTLIELMGVVVIVGILATLAIVSLRRYVFAARSSEATQMIGAIKAAQESYRDETFRYRDVSGSLTAYHPDAPGAKKMAWSNPASPQTPVWAELGVTATGPVMFGYACVADQGGTLPPTALSTPIAWPATTGPWYVVQAAADQDGDDIQAIYVSSSFSDQIFFEKEDE
jgi:type IV pilus assembly protein PilA